MEYVTNTEKFKDQIEEVENKKAEQEAELAAIQAEIVNQKRPGGLLA